PTGESRLELSFASGPRSESNSLISDSPAGTWSGPDGVSHPIAYHNLMVDPSWFPAFPIARALSPGYATAFVGQETHDSQSVQHLQIWRVSTMRTPRGTPTFQHLSQIDLHLDTTTLLPVAIAFNTHPDDDMGL